MSLNSRESDHIGRFEMHLTFEVPTSGSFDPLREFARRHDLKFTHIRLNRGVAPSQPMLTFRADSSLAEQLQQSQELSRLAEVSDLKITRIKIEADPLNEGVPQSQFDIQSPLSDRYFEHHVKLLLPLDRDPSSLKSLAERHSAHLSKNELQQASPRFEKRFLTQRCFNCGRDESRARLDRLVVDLNSSGETILDVEEEYVVYDSNLALDDGWMSSSELLT